jgi:hypothetical protein
MSIPNFGVVNGDGNAYVPNMTHHHHLDINNETTVTFTDTLVDATVLAALATVAISTTYDLGADTIVIPEPFGRNIQILSTDAGDITIKGTDFLGQQMTETITCTVGTVAGKKAFKRITGYVTAADLAGDITIKSGGEYGLPFCAVEVVREVVDGVASTDGVITAAVSATPTATTGDVRGTFNPNTAADGAKDIVVTYIATNALTGGLYGQVQA